MGTLTSTELDQLNKYFNATNYLAVGQLYLLDNPLLKRPLELKDVKTRPVGHWGTIPGQNFIFTHLNRAITKYNLNMIYLVGPGHGGQTAVTNAYLDGTYSEIYPTITQDEAGMKKLFKQFSFPGGISSHVAPETPGSIHEGGELGYTLSHALGAVLDNPDLIATAIVGDGEAETGPLATSWNVNKFINPISDGVVLPILHLNGFKISNPTVLSRLSHEELRDFFLGYGWEPYFVEGENPEFMHETMATIMDKVITKIKELKANASTNGNYSFVRWPMIILRTPKGWTGPTEVLSSFKAHQIPFEVKDDFSVEKLEKWMLSYKPEELFDENGRIFDNITTFLPKGNQRMSANPIANGGLLLQDLYLPNPQNYMLNTNHGSVEASDMMELGKYLRDVFNYNEVNYNFRIFSPDEAMSNRLNHVFEATDRQWLLPIGPNDEHMAPYGRVMDAYLSEHLAEGALEGYILTGRHGIIDSYEAFMRVIDSMVGIYAKWTKMCKEIPWRVPVSSLNIIETSHVWQQDHNGYTHQEPGFINHILNKKHDIVNVYLPYDANSLIYYTNKALKSRNMVNTIIASKHIRPQWLNRDETMNHCAKGIGIFDFASDDNPDVVLGCAGDTPTLETLAASQLLRTAGLKVRVVNVVDLLKLENLPDEEFDQLFTLNKPVVFAFHGYPNVIEEQIYERNHRFEIIHGYEEEGSITTPFDMRVINSIDRYHLTMDALRLLNMVSHPLYMECMNKLQKHKEVISETGEDMPEVLNWKWEDYK